MLRSFQYFKRVSMDGFTVVWLDGQDLCPDEIYNLGKTEEKFINTR